MTIDVFFTDLYVYSCLCIVCSHTLQVEYSKSLSELRTIRQKGDHAKKEMTQDYNQTVKEMEDLMQSAEEKDLEVQRLQSELQTLLGNKDNSDSNYDRVMEKLKQKQKDCDEYLEQMGMWRVQVRPHPLSGRGMSGGGVTCISL